MLRETSVGVKLLQDVWLDAGVMFFHIGYESMIARDALVVSALFTTHFTPYYQTGASVTWQTSNAVTITALV